MQFDTDSLPSPESLKEDMATLGLIGGGAALTGVWSLASTVHTIVKHPISSIVMLGGGTALGTLGIRRLTKDPNAASKETINVTPEAPAPAAA